MRNGFWRVLAVSGIMDAVSVVAQAGGMNEPVAEGPVVVVVGPPITPEPVHTGGYGTGPDSSPDSAGLPFADSDRDEPVQTYSVSQAPDGRVLCFTVAVDRRGAAGPFDLCIP